MADGNENVAASVTEGAAPASTTGNVTSGTASEAMIKAATAASSPASAPAGAAGDTSTGTSAAAAGATPDATGQAQATGQAATAAATRGEAPEARIQAAVRNAREKTRAEVEQQYAWAKGVDPEDVKVALSILADLRADSKGFHSRLGAELQSSAPSEEADEAYPAPDLVSQDGKLKTYSEATHLKILDIQARKIRRELMAELAPALNYVKTEQEGKADAEAKAHINAVVQSTLTEARKLPHFTQENEPLIIEKMKAIPVQTRRAIGPVAAMYMAYNQVLAEKVFPGIQTASETAAEAKVRDDYNRKANAARGQAHPTDQGGEGRAPKLSNVTDLAKHMEQLAAQATAP